MAMGQQILAASAVAGVNLLLLGVLLGVWLRNYRTFGTRFVLGLVGFAVALLVENGVALYYFFSMQSLYAGDPGVQTAVLVTRSVQFVAVATLTYVTVK
ncbi:hypothetical protein RYH80_11115 [Halobaculum sp. MBLA0147]|uniref:hypothetical protein n=1 Tax=Halobaculum sp. MBLA0147 TaxID=3079934 RepID=UPI003525C7CD